MLSRVCHDQALTSRGSKQFNGTRPTRLRQHTSNRLRHAAWAPTLLYVSIFQSRSLTDNRATHKQVTHSNPHCRFKTDGRIRTSEDGTPSVTFPRNFDRVVGLMGRNDLEEHPVERESKRNDASRGHSANKEGEKGGEHLPPWTKSLLEEGLDRTKAFSRYRGVLAGEESRRTRGSMIECGSSGRGAATICRTRHREVQYCLNSFCSGWGEWRF